MVKLPVLIVLFLLLSSFTSRLVIAAPGSIEAGPNFENEWYAKQFKVSIQEAERRQNLSNRASKVANEFDPETALFAGMIIKNDPPYRILFEIKRFEHCEKIKYTEAFKKDKRCNIVTRVTNRLKAEQIANDIEIVFVKHSKLDRDKIQAKATYYAQKYAKNEWSSIGWNPVNHKVEIGVLYKEKFENKLLAANVILPPEISVREVKALPTFY